MAGIIDSYKKVFENKAANIGLFVIVFCWMTASTMLDVKTGNFDKNGFNCFDILFDIIIGLYSIIFIHNAINSINNGILPSFKEMNIKVLWKMIKIKVLWAIYGIIIGIIAISLYAFLNEFILPLIIIIALCFVAIFIQYIYLAFAENYETKGLYNPILIFKFIKPAIKSTLIKFILFGLITLAAFVAYILVYMGAGLLQLDTMGYIAKDYYVFDIIMLPVAGYFMMITWCFAYPYSLINTYNRAIRPVIRKDKPECLTD